MADTTQISAEELRNAADRIGGIISDDVLAVFNDLDDEPPSAGSNPTGTWVHDRASDRIKAVQKHGLFLKTAFDDISTGLRTVADQLSSNDTNNGEKLLSTVQGIEQNIDTDSGATPPPTDTGSGSGSGSGSDSSSTPPPVSQPYVSSGATDSSGSGPQSGPGYFDSNGKWVSTGSVSGNGG